MSLRTLLDLSAFKCRLEDPTIPVAEKLGRRPFVVTSMTNKHIKFARAQITRGRVRLEPPKSANLEDVSGLNLNDSLVQEMLALTQDKLLICGLNTTFKMEKLYSRGTKVRDIERLVSTDAGLRAQVTNGTDTTTNYSPFPVKDQVFLGAMDNTRITEHLKRLKEHGFRVAAIHNLPCTLISAMGDAPLEWDHSGVAVFFQQNMAVILSWSKKEILNVRSRAFAPSTSNQKPSMKPAAPGVLQDLLKTIKEQTDWTKKMSGSLKNVYIHASFDGQGEKQAQTLNQMVQEATELVPQPIPWTNLLRKAEFAEDTQPNPELACLF